MKEEDLKDTKSLTQGKADHAGLESRLVAVHERFEHLPGG